MYVSRKKKNVPSKLPDAEVYVPTGEDRELEKSILREELSSETFSEGETLEIGRDLFLEPEDEPWENAMDAEKAEEDDTRQGQTQDVEDQEDILVPDDPQDLDEGEADPNKEDLTYEEYLSENNDQGVLRVQASAGGQSIPLANVKITVYRDLADGRHIFYTVTTDHDGVADGMILPAPPRENSVEGNAASPFASYSVAAQRDGLRSAIVENVPIFAGVKSIQPLILSPSESEV